MTTAADEVKAPTPFWLVSYRRLPHNVPVAFACSTYADAEQWAADIRAGDLPEEEYEFEGATLDSVTVTGPLYVGGAQ